MAINQTQVKNNVYKAIEVIAEQRIDSLKLDKTIIGTVENKISNGNNQYRIKYNGGTLYAYAQDDSVYLPNTTVYVLVPENDFNNKKWIVGRVSNTKVDQNIDVVGHALNEYSVIGTNTVYVADEELTDAFKLQSYSVRRTGETYQDANILYDAKQPEISVLGINVGDLETYMRQSQAISFAADFRTSLTKEQQRNVSGDYGLIFNVRLKNKNTSYPTMQDKWDALEPNTRTKIDIIPEPEYRGLSYYEQEIRGIITNQTQTTQQMQQAIDGINQSMIEFIAKTAATFDSDTQSLVNQYAQLINDILALTVNNAGEPITPGDILAEYIGWFNGESDSYVEVVESYFLDVNNMVGNPYNLKEYTHQYITVPIEAERFVGIDAIYFYCDGFIQDYTKAEQWGYDLFVKDIEINCLEELDDVNNEYRLTLDFPQGAIFRTNESADIRLVRAHIVYQNREDLTPFCTFSWFKQNSAVTPQSSKYNAMAGSGWERVSIDSITTEVEFAAVDNKAYENHYKVIGTYNLETILIKQFILYNEANKHNVELVCDSGFAFEFSDSTKTIICEIDGESQPEAYEYIWSIDGEALTITADQYREIIAELQASPELTTEILRQISLYKSQLNKVDGIIWDNNILQFPSSKMPANGEVYIRCGVRKDGYDIGVAEATLSQGNVITLKGYYIEIENGNQTFQYNEAGVSPASERYNEPIEILPLHCKFYSPSGNLINSLNYTVKWKVPLENTLIIVDRTKVDEEGISPYAVCNFAISDDYNYSSLNNQILCIVEFNGDVYTETTDFYFGKIGENGTNGTDVVAKIVPIGEKTNSVLNNELLALNVYSDGTSRWNTGAAIDTAVLELQLFRRNTYLSPEEYKLVKWSMSGNTRAREMSVYPSAEGNIYGAISYDAETSGRERFRNQIVKGQASLRVNDEYQAYNYFYPIPTIIWEEGIVPFSIGIDKTYTLRQVLYNADGRNPVYNKNQGARLNLPESYHISWTTVGGIDEIANTAALKIEKTEDNHFVQAEPADVYSGEYTNNCIKAEVLNEDNELQCTVYIPIHMSLNTYGLASLNAWDGNSIEIDEDQGYILAPQIGAGEKHIEDNTFTGVVMGVEKTYEGDRNVGLLGYSHGEQSIFLDAASGNATFGLPASQGDINERYTEGRIELRPGGVSKIGNWNIGSRFLYNIVPPEGTDPDYTPESKDISSAYTDSDASNHVRDIPHESRGVLLSSDPSYLSIKGRKLTSKDITSNANRVVNPGDSLEVQLDPNQRSLFTVFRHYKDKRGDWQRSATVGIDRQGRFYSNALRQESTSLAIGYVGAFGQIAAEEAYLGVSVDVNDDTTIWKMFAGYPYSEVTPQEGDIPIDNDWYEINSENRYVPTTDEEVISEKTYYKKDPITKDSPLYISGGSSENDDYQRPIQIMGKELNLRSSANDDNSRINMTTTSLMLGQKNAKLSLNNTTGSLNTSGAFSRSIGGVSTDSISENSTITIGGALSETVIGNVSKTWANSYVQDSSTRFRVYGKTQGSITPYDLILSRNGTDNSYLSVNNHRFILQSNSSHGASSNAGGSIALEALNTNYGITLRSTPVSGSGTAYEAGLRMLPSRGGNAFFNLYATGTAQVNSTANVGYTFYDYTDNANRRYAASGSTGVSIFNNLGTHGVYVDRGARNVAFATTTIKGSKHGDYQYTSDGTNVWDLIYDCLNAAEDARNAARSAHDRANAAYSYADEAYGYADSAMSRANSAYSNADGRVDWGTYNGHTHRTTGYTHPYVASIVTGSEGNIVHIGTGDLVDDVTGGPE